MINKNQDILENLGQELEKTARAPLSEFRIDQNTAMPAELRNWLVSLRLLNGVPFANLVADSELLPQESIRWFYMDRRWTDALVQGALSVGTVNSDDRIQLDAQYNAIRAELRHVLDRDRVDVHYQYLEIVFGREVAHDRAPHSPAAQHHDVQLPSSGRVITHAENQSRVGCVCKGVTTDRHMGRDRKTVDRR